MIPGDGVEVIAELRILRDDDGRDIVFRAERVEAWHSNDRQPLGQLVHVDIGNAKLLRGIFDADLIAADILPLEAEERLVDQVRRGHARVSYHALRDGS